MALQSYVVRSILKGKVTPLLYTEAPTPTQAWSKLESALINRQALVHPLAQFDIVLVDHPPENEDR